MLKRLIFLVPLFFASATLAQNTATISATIIDNPDGTPWSNGTWTATFYNPRGGTATYINGGQPVSPLQFTGGVMNNGGLFNQLNFPLNNAIAPAGTQWQFTFCPNAITGCVSLPPLTISQGGDISAQFASYIKSPRFPANGANQFGYGDVEVSPTPVPGGFYYNVILGCQRIWNGSAWNCQATGNGGTIPNPPAMSVQAANATANGLVSDQNILINTNTHTLSSMFYGNLPTITIPDDCPGIFGNPGSSCNYATGANCNDDAVTLQACIHAHPSAHVLFRKTQPPSHCDYYFGRPIYPEGGDTQWEGMAGGGGGGVTFCRPADVTGIWISNYNNKGVYTGAQQAHIHHINLQGSNPWSNVVSIDYIVPEMLGGTGSNAPGLLINADGVTADHMRITQSAGAGIYVMSSDALYTNIVSATWGQLINGIPSAQIVTDVGHGCADNMAALITGIPGGTASGLTGSSIASGPAYITFVNPTTITFPLTPADSPSGSFSGTGAHLSCNSYTGASGLNLYAIADLFKVYANWSSGNRGDGFWAFGADSNAGKVFANQFLSNQLNGIREHSFLGNNYDSNQTDSNGEEKLTLPAPVAMTNVGIANNRISFQSTDSTLISNAAYPYQGSHITVSGCVNTGPVAITAADVVASGSNYLLRVAVTGAEALSAAQLSGSTITINGLTLSGNTAGYNFNQTYSNLVNVVTPPPANGVAGSQPGWSVILPNYAGGVVPGQTVTGATATNFPTSANTYGWWIYSYSAPTWTARSNPFGQRTSVPAGQLTGCQAQVWPGGQIWAAANVTGGSADFTGPANTNLVVDHYAEANQRSVRCSGSSIIIGGDIGSGVDITDCTGRYWNQVGLTPIAVKTYTSNVTLNVGPTSSPTDAWSATNTGCTPTVGSPPLGSNSCTVAFSETQPSNYLNTQDWFGFNGSTVASSSVSQVYEYSLLLGYAHTTQNTDGNHPPAWIPNRLYLGSTTANVPQLSISEGTGPPTTGTYNAGARMLNTAPSNGISEWICTVGGTPGTWIPINTTGYIQSASSTGGCSTGASSYDSCSVTVPFNPGFADTNYQVTCTAQNPTTSQGGCSGTYGCQMGYISGVIKSNTSVVAIVGTSGGNIVTVTGVDCIARHN